VEGSEEHFDENVAEEEDSTNGEDGSDEEVREIAGLAREKARWLSAQWEHPGGKDTGVEEKVIARESSLV